MPLGSFAAGIAARRHVPEMVLGALAVATFVVLRDMAITHDVVWQFWIARQLLAGAKLYDDIWEINPPLWFWSAVPVEYAGRVLHVPGLRLLVPIVVALGAMSAALLGQLGGFATPARRLAAMVLTFWLTVIAPVFNFGQREQLALIFALPYAALIARRSVVMRTPGDKLPLALAVLVSALAAYGFALKHYFAIVPLLLEGWLYLRVRPKWQALRPETIVLATAAVVYGLCMVIFTPAFFTQAVPMTLVAYHGFENDLGQILIKQWTLVWAIIAGWFALYGAGFGKRADPLVSALLVAAAGFAIAYVAQAKAWSYHGLPVTGAAALALGIRLFGQECRRSVPLLLGLAILAVPVCTPLRTGTYANALRDQIDPALQAIPADQPVFVAAADPMWAWPALEDHGLRWPSRLYAYWMIPAIAQGEIIGPNPPALRALAGQIQDEAALEIRCAPPALIVFERQPRYDAQPASFDERAFFLRQPDLRAFVGRYYREISETPALFIYRRVSPAPALHAAACPTTR